jgi:uncharacterized protein involved in outer membrane biogenesis
MKLLAGILLVLVAIALIPVFFGDRLVHRYAVSAIEEATGFTAEIGQVDVGIFRPVFRLQDLTLRNPPEFPSPDALTIREVFVKYDLLSLFSDNIRLAEVRIDVPRIVMVRPERGDSNIEALAKAGKRKSETAPPKETNDTPPAKPVESTAAKPAKNITIDKLNIKFGEMEARQYRKDQPEPMVMTVPINMDRSFVNVTNLQTVASEVAGELIVRSGFNVLGQIHSLMNSPGAEESREKIKQQLKELKGLFRKSKTQEVEVTP